MPLLDGPTLHVQSGHEVTRGSAEIWRCGVGDVREAFKKRGEGGREGGRDANGRGWGGFR